MVAMSKNDKGETVLAFQKAEVDGEAVADWNLVGSRYSSHLLKRPVGAEAPWCEGGCQIGVNVGDRYVAGNGREEFGFDFAESVPLMVVRGMRCR